MTDRDLSKGQMLLVEDGFPRELILSEDERAAARTRPVTAPQDEAPASKPFDPYANERKRFQVKRLLTRVARSRDRAAAAAGMRWCTRRSRWVDEQGREEADMPTKMEMLAEYNDLATKLGLKTRKTFDDRAQAEVFLSKIRSEEAQAQAPAAPAAGDQPEERTEMAKKKVKVKAKANGREVGKPAKPVSELKAIRAGTVRAKILAQMDGSKTPAQIAAPLDIEASYVLAHAHCLWRDAGVGYKLEDGKLTAIYPGQKTIRDVVAQAKG
jgi:hypothetical protein